MARTDYQGKSCIGKVGGGGFLFLGVLELVPDLKCVPDKKNPFLILTFFSSDFRSFHIRSFKNSSNIFQNAFYVFLLFRNDGIVLDNFVCFRERTITPKERRSALSESKDKLSLFWNIVFLLKSLAQQYKLKLQGYET